MNRIDRKANLYNGNCDQNYNILHVCSSKSREEQKYD